VLAGEKSRGSRFCAIIQPISVQDPLLLTPSAQIDQVEKRREEKRRGERRALQVWGKDF